MDEKVNFYFDKAGKWQPEIMALRAIVLDCGLTEALKWGCPCYTYNDANIVLIHVFKEYCALLFFKGALLKSNDGLLVQPTENVQSARQVRFTGIDGVITRETEVRALIFQAIEVEKAGLKVDLKKTSEFPVVDELQIVLDDMPELKAAFAELTPGRQRAYLLHFSAAKQSATRVTRIQKVIPKILSGKGLNDE